MNDDASVTIKTLRKKRMVLEMAHFSKEKGKKLNL
jgi:hypothetical protein